MNTSENLLDEFKNAWNKPNNAIAQIIIINVIVFLVMLTLSIFLKVSGEAEIYRSIEELLMLPSDLNSFLFRGILFGGIKKSAFIVFTFPIVPAFSKS